MRVAPRTAESVRRKARSGEKGLPVFFNSLLRALQFEGVDASGLGDLSEADWRDLIEFCDLAHLTLPLLRNHSRFAPDWVVARARGNLADNRLRVSRIESAYVEIKMALADAGIEHLVVKGFSQYPEFVEALEDRMQSDIDIYCPQQYSSAACQVLKSLGYEADRTLSKYPADHLPEMTRRRGWVWRGNMYDPEMPPAVDLHFCFWNSTSSRLPVAGTDQFWARRIERHSNGFSFPALSSTDNLAFTALHVLRDLTRGDWVLHHVYELAYFLHTHADDPQFWELWMAHHDDELRSLQLISFWLARDWFHCCLPEAVAAEMNKMPQPVWNWLRRFGRSPLIGMFDPNKHGTWLHLALLRSRRDKFLVLAEALMPVRLPAIGASGQLATKTRRMRRFWPSQRHARYLLHILLRSTFHLRASINTLWHGLIWWRDLRKLRNAS